MVIDQDIACHRDGNNTQLLNLRNVYKDALYYLSVENNYFPILLCHLTFGIFSM